MLMVYFYFTFESIKIINHCEIKMNPSYQKNYFLISTYDTRQVSRLNLSIRMALFHKFSINFWTNIDFWKIWYQFTHVIFKQLWSKEFSCMSMSVILTILCPVIVHHKNVMMMCFYPTLAAVASVRRLPDSTLSGRDLGKETIAFCALRGTG